MSQTSTYPRNVVQQKQIHYSPNLLSVIDNAIEHCKVATIEHDSYEKGISLRDVEPLALVFKDHKRSLVAWCRLRNDFRSFRLDRINCIKIKQEEFKRREDFNINDFQDDPNAVNKEEYEAAH